MNKTNYKIAYKKYVDSFKNSPQDIKPCSYEVWLPLYKRGLAKA